MFLCQFEESYFCFANLLSQLILERDGFICFELIGKKLFFKTFFVRNHKKAFIFCMEARLFYSYLFLYISGLSPYDGVVFHESPLLLRLYILLEPLLVNYSTLSFILLDLFTCVLLGQIGDGLAKTLLSEQKRDKNEVHPEAGSILISSNLLNTLPKSLSIFYLLNPYLLLNCAAKTTTVWNNLLVSLVLLAQVRCSRILGTLALSLAAYQGFYPVILIFPLAIQIALSEGNHCS